VCDPDVTGDRDPLSLEAVQWMNAACDVLKTRDWTEPPSQAARTVHAGHDWTDVRDPTDKKTQRWREQQQRKRQEEEQERQRQAEETRRRNEKLAKRSFWQGIMWGADNLENPGFLWWLFHLSSLIVRFVCSVSLIYFMSGLIIGSVSNIILAKAEFWGLVFWRYNCIGAYRFYSVGTFVAAEIISQPVKTT